ncbi:MAG: 23S rRNA (uridine(2552)-2'-O)-methyltransferase [Halopenitus sp.]
MSGKDKYYNKSKQEGYRTRASYKLQQLDETAHLFDGGETVVDLGAAPGGWLQVAAERVNDHGKVVGVDFKRIDELEFDTVTTLKGDMTEEKTRDRLRDEVGEHGADVVISDMAPNMTGEYELDHARSVHLARQALDTAMELLAPGGDFVVKVFQGQDLDALKDDVAEEFDYVRTVNPDASRDSSSEVYLVGKSRFTAPVEEGDQVEVEIEEVGEEGDGIAYLDGYTLFVPGGEEGETVDVVIQDLKPKFGFAERLD